MTPVNDTWPYRAVCGRAAHGDTSNTQPPASLALRPSTLILEEALCCDARQAAPKKKVKAPPKDIGPMMEEDIIPGLMTVRRAPPLSPSLDARSPPTCSLSAADDCWLRRAGGRDTAAEPG